MLKKIAMTKRKSKTVPLVRPRKLRRNTKANARECQPPMNYLMEEHPELNGAC